MSIWGKVLGGAAGFAMGGPLGAIVGAALGHVADKQSNDDGEPREATKEISFTIGVIVLGAKMAKADGIVTRDEVTAFRQVFHVPPHEVKNVARIFDRAKREAEGFEPYAQQLARMFSNNKGVLEDLLDSLFHIAKADDVLHPAEIEFLQRTAAIFGFNASEYERIQAGHATGDDKDPYVILGVDRGADDATIKAQYRKLIRENHPDMLIAQGVPQEFVDIANDKLAAINDAYDQVQKHRGLT
jgi:DnaJ like chaperone protein